MEEKKQHFECEGCAGEFTVETDEDMICEFCVFCGEPLDDADWEEEETLDFHDTI